VAFTLFAAGSLVLGAVVIPLSRVVPSSAEGRAMRVQRLVHHGFRLFVWIMKTLGLIRVRWIGRDRLRDGSGMLIVANHPTLIDVVLLIAALPRVDCVVKRSHWRSPLLRRVIEPAAYIPNDNGRSMIATCMQRLQTGRSVLLFPEGTRSPFGQLGTFGRAAAHIAFAARRPIVPIIIRCVPPTLSKGAKWYDVPDRTVALTIEVADPISVDTIVGGAAEAAASRALTRIVHEFYETRLRGAVPIS
jgi:1-acyl-sn-glycerol-3-phosphate acyltransferase